MKNNVLLLTPTVSLFLLLSLFRTSILAQTCPDDRDPSQEAALARLRIVGNNPCTAFLLANGKLVTAGHCFNTAGEYIIEFNVPNSNPDGTLNLPEDEQDIFQVDEVNAQRGLGPGNDWAVFEVFPNELPGGGEITPLEKYGAYLTVAQMEPQADAEIRITGYGWDAGILRNTQQTVVGLYEDLSVTTISFRTFVHQGNSGSPVIDEASGLVVGVEYAEQGCPNIGTSTFNQAFWDAMEISAITLDQRNEADGRFSNSFVGRWVDDEFEDILIRTETPTVINTGIGFGEVLRGYQEVLQDEKYNRWNNLTKIVNHQLFVFQNPTEVMVSWFKSTYGSVIVTTDLLDAPGTTGGTIKFKDPWLIDSVDQEFGNTLFNRGNEALFKSRSSPFSPHLTVPQQGDLYRGIFKSQEVGVDLPYYSVEAPEVNHLGIQNIKSYFHIWSAPAEEASIPDPSENVTGIVFESENATIKALYKAHLHSSSVNAVARNSTRRMMRDLDGRYHLVYESAGSIWYTRSTNGGQAWSPETIVLERNEDFSLREPSITVQQDPHTIAVVCEAYSTTLTESLVLLVLIDPVTGELLPSEPSVSSLDGTTSTFPVVASAVDTDVSGTNYLLVAWFDPNGPSMKARIRKENGVWYEEGVLKNAPVADISVAPICVANGDKWHIVWKEGENLYYSQVDVYGGVPALETPNFILADGSAAEIDLDNPSVVRLFKSQGNPAVAWEEYNSELSKRRIKFRERLGTDPPTWSNATVWSGSLNSYFYNPSLSGQHLETTAFLAWRSGNGLKYVKRSNMTWTQPTNLASGYDPMLAVGWHEVTTELAAYRKSAAQPYKFGMTGVPPTPPPLTRGGEMLPSGRGGRILYDGGMIHMVVLDPQIDELPISFAALNDTLAARTPTEFAAALRTEAFSGVGTLSLQFIYSASGSLPPEAIFLANIHDATTDQLLATSRVFLGLRDTIMTASIPLNFRNRSVRLVLQPGGFSGARTLEVEQWFIVGDEDSTGVGISAPIGASGLRGETLPRTYALHQNYPNPFNPLSTIRYEIPEETQVTVKVYDVLGKEVATLVDAAKPAGYHEAVVDATRLASGVYLYKLKAGPFTEIKKMVLMK